MIPAPSSSGAVRQRRYVSESWTNYGSRVDVHGWGDSVATLGYGDSGEWSRVNRDDSRQFYTGGFSGTSSASPIVAGAVAAIQGIRKTRSLPVLDPFQMRRTLRDTGTPQSEPASRNIGPLPNLRAALNRWLMPPPGAAFAAVSSLVSCDPAKQRAGSKASHAARRCLYHMWQNGMNTVGPVGLV